MFASAGSDSYTSFPKEYFIDGSGAFCDPASCVYYELDGTTMIAQGGSSMLDWTGPSLIKYWTGGSYDL